MNDLIREISEFTAAWKAGSLTRKDAAELLFALAQAWLVYETGTPFGDEVPEDVDAEAGEGERLYSVASELIDYAGDEAPAIEGPLLPILLPILIRIILEQLGK